MTIFYKMLSDMSPWKLARSCLEWIESSYACTYFKVYTNDVYQESFRPEIGNYLPYIREKFIESL